MADKWFDEESVDSLCDKIDEKIELLRRKYLEDEYSDEDELSVLFASSLESAVQNHELTYRPAYGMAPGGGSSGKTTRLEAELYGLKTRKLTSRNDLSEEVKFGADLLLLFESRIDGLKKKKGILIQCKDNKNRNFNKTKRPDLRKQCQKMHKVTDASYVLIFAKNGFYFINNPQPVENIDFYISRDHALSLRAILKDFFVCVGGDTGITTARKGDFEVIANELIAKRTLNVVAD